MIEWRRSERLIKQIVEEEGPQPTVEVYDSRYMDFLEGQREDVPKDEDNRGVIIIPLT
jgi:hypothetical protein